MDTRRFTATVVGFGALAASLMVLPGVLDASSPQGTGGGTVDGTKECTDAGFPNTIGVKDEAPFVPNPQVVMVNGGAGTITFTYSNPKPDEPTEFLTVTVTFEGDITGVAIVGKAGQAVLVDDSSPFELTFTQGISNVAACYTNGTAPTTTTTTVPETTTTTTIPETTTTTTIPETTTTTIPETTTTTTTTIAETTTTAAETTTTAAGETTTTAGETTTTAAGGSSTTVTPTTAGPTTTIVPPPNTGTLPNTGSNGSSNVIAIAVLALLGGALALVIARRRAL